MLPFKVTRKKERSNRMKIKKRELLKFAEVIKSFEGLKYSTKFSYFLTKNKLACKDELEALDEARKPDQKFLDFELERVKTAQEHSEKGADGSPVIRNGAFIILPDNQEKFDKEMAKLRKVNKVVIEAREKQAEEFDKLIGEETEFNGTKIKLSELPTQIEPALLEVLVTLDLIIED